MLSLHAARFWQPCAIDEGVVKWCATMLGLVLGGCQVVAGYESFGEAPPHPCDGMPTRRDDPELGPEVLIKAKDGRCFWIDETEVTVRQYDRFVNERPAELWPQDSQSCGWKLQQLSNPRFDDANTCRIEAQDREPEPFDPDKPMRCIDWCDARAFCIWAGKDLCAIRPSVDNYYPVEPEQWSIACSPTSAYPYGSTPERRACNIGIPPEECGLLTGGKCSVSKVKHFAHCTYPGGPFDMVGNVSEWVLPCEVGNGNGGDGASDYCVHRGGSFEDSELEVSCSLPALLTERRDQRSRTRGFRCCAPVQ